MKNLLRSTTAENLLDHGLAAIFVMAGLATVAGLASLARLVLR